DAGSSQILRGTLNFAYRTVPPDPDVSGISPGGPAEPAPDAPHRLRRATLAGWGQPCGALMEAARCPVRRSQEARPSRYGFEVRATIPPPGLRRVGPSPPMGGSLPRPRPIPAGPASACSSFWRAWPTVAVGH